MPFALVTSPSSWSCGSLIFSDTSEPDAVSLIASIAQIRSRDRDHRIALGRRDSGGPLLDGLLRFGLARRAGRDVEVEATGNVD